MRRDVSSRSRRSKRSRRKRRTLAFPYQSPNPPPEDSDADFSDARVTPEQAGYLELPGAVKDGDCTKVEVDGGVSLALGCCNLFDYDASTEAKFSCGTCSYRTGATPNADEDETVEVELTPDEESEEA